MRTVIVGVALAVGATFLAAGPVRAQVTAEAIAASDVPVSLRAGDVGTGGSSTGAVEPKEQ